MQMVFSGHIWHEMSKPVFSENKKNIFDFSSADLSKIWVGERGL